MGSRLYDLRGEVMSRTGDGGPVEWANAADGQAERKMRNILSQPEVNEWPSDSRILNSVSSARRRISISVEDCVR